MKQKLLNNWNFVRLVRLGMGIAIIVQAVAINDTLFGFIGLLLAGMALFNAGCCGTGSCYLPESKNREEKKDIHYEEVIVNNRSVHP